MSAMPTPNTPLHIVQVVSVRIKPGADEYVPKRTYDRLSDWLGQWTCKANMEAIIAGSLEDALIIAAQSVKKVVKSRWSGCPTVCPSLFEFEVSHQEVKNNRFWMGSAAVWCRWHPVNVGE